MTDQDRTTRETQESVDVMQGPEVPQFYVNGFSLGASHSDVYMLAQTGRSASALLFMSYTTAKTLAEHLGSLIADFEEKTGQTLLTMKDVQDKVFRTDDEGQQ